MKTKNILLALFSIFLLSACHSQQTGTYNIMDYGATGDGKTDDAQAIQKAINACSEAGGGTVLVPSGHTFLCGPFKLASHISLYAEPGIVYYFDDGSDISTIRKEKPFNINLQAGLRFNF